jgi:LEA14-like dessication related protein
MKKMILTMAPAVWLLVSCKSDNIKEPEYREIRDVRITNVGVMKTTAKLNMVYYNPNSFGVHLSDASGEIFVDNIHLGRFSIDENVRVKKRREFVVPALIKLNNISAITNYKELMNKKKAIVRIEGVARVKKAGFTTEVPIRYEGMQNIEKLKDLFPLK